jgi:CDP-glucose 4,6-dehydratase
MIEFERLAGVDVLVTGHTGFTGSWAALWLASLGARVHGLALQPETTPNMFERARVGAALASHTIGDINDLGTVLDVVERYQPRLVLHLAAQPLVLRSYEDPVTTFMTNVQGTVHVLEAARRNPGVAGVVAITTDKVYQNDDDGAAFAETDRLGGSDPYSASKACAELAIASYRASLPSWGRRLAIASARGGNIIGGGDWSDNRLIPDFVRAAERNRVLDIRNPEATRPWQHVLCLVEGYLTLLDRMLDDADSVAEAWNFGPSIEDCVPVRRVLDDLMAAWKPVDIRYGAGAVHEAARLAVDATKARHRLGWQGRWRLDQALHATADWYRAAADGESDMHDFTLGQITQYQSS